MNALDTLSDTPPAAITVRLTHIKQLHADIATLESELGIPSKPQSNSINPAMMRLKILKSIRSARSARPVASTSAISPTKVPDQVPFVAMSNAARAQFAADGGSISKTEFDKLTARAKTDFCTGGGKITDNEIKRNAFGGGKSFGTIN